MTSKGYFIHFSGKCLAMFQVCWQLSHVIKCKPCLNSQLPVAFSTRVSEVWDPAPELSELFFVLVHIIFFCPNAIRIIMRIIWRLYRIILRWYTGWWCNNHLEKWWSESQWEGWHPIYEMENKIHVPNHQPALKYLVQSMCNIFLPQVHRFRTPKSTFRTCTVTPLWLVETAWGGPCGNWRNWFFQINWEQCGEPHCSRSYFHSSMVTSKIANGHFRNPNWRYLPHIRPI